MSQIQLSVINMSQYYGLEVLKYIRMIYKWYTKAYYLHTRDYIVNKCLLSQ